MANIFKKPYNINLPKNQREVEEMGSGKKGIIICKCENCQSVYYKKSWHHSLENAGIKEESPSIKIKFMTDPACQMIKDGKYEGITKIHNVPSEIANELEKLIKNFGNYIYQRDALDRLIKIEKNGKNWEATFTENQAAAKLARKIKSTFNNNKISIKYNREPSDVSIAVIEFTKPLSATSGLRRASPDKY